MALREQLQLNLKKKSRSVQPVASTLYQRYCHPVYKRSDQKISVKQKNSMCRDGNRMLCKICGRENHFTKQLTVTSVNDFPRLQYRNRSLDVHIYYDLAEMVDSRSELFENAHVKGHRPDPAVFNKLHETDSHRDKDDGYAMNQINAAATMRHIAKFMNFLENNFTTAGAQGF